jgi:hypothetical protein
LVTREAPFTWATEPDTNSAPLTVNVSELLPAGRVGGATELPCGGGLVIVKSCDTETRLPGLITATFAYPATAIALAGMAAVS